MIKQTRQYTLINRVWTESEPQTVLFLKCYRELKVWHYELSHGQFPKPFAADESLSVFRQISMHVANKCSHLDIRGKGGTTSLM